MTSATSGKRRISVTEAESAGSAENIRDSAMNAEPGAAAGPIQPARCGIDLYIRILASPTMQLLLLVQDDRQKRPVDFDFAVVLDEA
jgi:hypothetical protein